MVLFGDDDEKSQRAFAEASQLRRYRDELVAEIRREDLTLTRLFELDRGDSRVGSIKAVVLIEALPGVGKVAARRALAGVGLEEDVRVGQLGGDARERLANALGPSERKLA